MGKRLLAVFLALFVGLCSHAEAGPFLEKANHDIAVMAAIGKIDDPDKRAEAMRQYLDEVKPALEQAIKKNDFNKFACKFSKPGEEDTWLIIYEHKSRALASAWFCKGNPPDDAKIIEGRRVL